MVMTSFCFPPSFDDIDLFVWRYRLLYLKISIYYFYVLTNISLKSLSFVLVLAVLSLQIFGYEAVRYVLGKFCGVIWGTYIYLCTRYNAIPSLWWYLTVLSTIHLSFSCTLVGARPISKDISLSLSPWSLMLSLSSPLSFWIAINSRSSEMISSFSPI